MNTLDAKSIREIDETISEMGLPAVIDTYRELRRLLQEKVCEAELILAHLYRLPGSGAQTKWNDLESQVRGLHGVTLVDGEKRVTLEGVRASRNAIGVWHGSRRVMPKGSRAGCSCCGRLVEAIREWSGLQLCDECSASEYVAPDGAPR